MKMLHAHGERAKIGIFDSKPVEGCPINRFIETRRNKDLAFGGGIRVQFDHAYPVKAMKHSEFVHNRVINLGGDQVSEIGPGRIGNSLKKRFPNV